MGHQDNKILGSRNVAGVTVLFLADYHIHSSWCDGEQTVNQILRQSKKLKLNAIAITDHARKDSPWVTSYISELKSYQKSSKRPLVIIGLEVKILNFNGEIDIDPNWIPNLNIVLIAIHRIPGITKENIPKFKDKIPYFYGELLISAIKKVNLSVPTIIAHPGKWLKENDLPFIPEEMWSEIARTARKYGKIIEYNTSAPPPQQFIKLLISEKVQLSVGSDAHRVTEIGRDVFKAIELVGDSLVKAYELMGNESDSESLCCNSREK